VATPNAAAMHGSSAKPPVIGDRDTRAYDDHDNLDDEEESSIYASSSDKIVGISSVEMLVPKHCNCKCQCTDKCFCGTSLCNLFTSEVTCGSCTVSQALNWDGDDGAISEHIEAFLAQVMQTPIEDYEAMLIEIDVPPEEHSFDEEYLKWLKVHAKRVILWAHIKLNHINFQDVIYNIDNGALDGPEHEELRDGFDGDKWEHIKWTILHTSPKQFSCTDCTMAKIEASNKVMVSQRQDYHAPLSRGTVDAVGMFPIGHGGKRWGILFRCDDSQFAKVAFTTNLQHDQLVRIFQHWRFEATESGWKMRRLHFDAGSIFTSERFQDAMGEMQVGCVYGPPGQHWANALIENFVRTVEVTAVTMLRASGLSLWYWSFAFRFAVWLSNHIMRRKRAMNKQYLGKTPYEIVHGRRFKRRIPAFGQAVVARIPDANDLPKLSIRGRMCVFLGFTDKMNHESAILLHLATGKVIYSRDYQIMSNLYGYTKKIIAAGHPNTVGSDIAQSAAPQPKLKSPTVARFNANKKPRLQLEDIDDDGELKESTMVDPLPNESDSEEDVPYFQVNADMDADPPITTESISTSTPGVTARQSYDESLQQYMDTEPSIRRSDRLRNIPPDGIMLQCVEMLYNYSNSVQAHYTATANEKKIQPLQSKHNYALNTQVNSRWLPQVFYTQGLTIVQCEEVQDSYRAIVMEQMLGNQVEVNAIDVYLATQSSKKKVRSKMVDFGQGYTDKVDIPRNYNECHGDPEKFAGFVEAEQVHAQMIMRRNCIGEPVEAKPPHISNLLKTVWVYDIKTGPDNVFIKYKARLCIQGFTQRYLEHYRETYCPTAHPESNRLILILIATYRWHCIQFDVSDAFMTTTPDVEQWCKYPPGMPDYGTFKNHSVQILLNWWGTKQAARLWFESVVPKLNAAGYIQTKSDKALWYKLNRENGLRTLLTMHIDDGHGASQDPDEAAFLLETLQYWYDLTSKEIIDHMLGMYIARNPDGSHTVFNDVYFHELALELGLNPATMPRPKVPGLAKIRYLPNTTGRAPQDMVKKYMTGCGSLNWAARMFKPEICCRVRELGQFLINPSFEHYDAMIQILCYCLGTDRLGLHLRAPALKIPRDLKLNVITYIDADWNKESDCKSVSGYCILLCEQREIDLFMSSGIVPRGNYVSFASKKQADKVAESTKSAEHYACCYGTNTTEFMINSLKEVGLFGHGPSPVLNDNLAVVVNSMEFKVPTSQRHNALKFAILEERIRDKLIIMLHVSGNLNVADMFTKVLDYIPFERHRNMMMSIAQQINSTKVVARKLLKKPSGTAVQNPISSSI